MMPDGIAQIFQVEDLTGTLTIAEIAIALVGSFLLTAVVGYVYKVTHKAKSYSQSYVQTIVLMGIVVALVMLIVGSNIARAFSLVGALSIIRFRNAVKETRDVGFIFWAMAIGMAAGTKFFALAIAATVVIAAAVLLMDRLDWYRLENVALVLILQVDDDFRFESGLEDVWARFADTAKLQRIDTTPATFTQLQYLIELKVGASPRDLLDALRERTGDLKVTLALST